MAGLLTKLSRHVTAGKMKIVPARFGKFFVNLFIIRCFKDVRVVGY